MSRGQKHKAGGSRPGLAAQVGVRRPDGWGPGMRRLRARCVATSSCCLATGQVHSHAEEKGMAWRGTAATTAPPALRSDMQLARPARRRATHRRQLGDPLTGPWPRPQRRPRPSWPAAAAPRRRGARLQRLRRWGWRGPAWRGPCGGSGPGRAWCPPARARRSAQTRGWSAAGRLWVWVLGVCGCGGGGGVGSLWHRAMAAPHRLCCLASAASAARRAGAAAGAAPTSARSGRPWSTQPLTRM